MTALSGLSLSLLLSVSTGPVSVKRKQWSAVTRMWWPLRLFTMRRGAMSIRHGKVDRSADILANDGVRIGGTDFDRQLSLGVIMPLFGFGSAMKRPGLDVPSSYFHDLATWSNINRMYEPRVIADTRLPCCGGIIGRVTDRDGVGAFDLELLRTISK